MNELALFAGAGGGILGGKLLGWRTVCAVERDAYAAAVLAQRQNDGCLEPFPIWSDVETFDGKPWRGCVDVVSAGFPCTDISIAKSVDAKGLDGEKSGLWDFAKPIIRDVGPRFVIVENSSAITFRGFERVLADLAAMGFDARWGVLGAHHAGGYHRRDRMWVVADSFGDGLQGWDGQAGEQRRSPEKPSIQALVQNTVWPSVSDPRAYGSNDELAYRVDRTIAIGNGQVPAVVKLAWEILGPSKLN